MSPLITTFLAKGSEYILPKLFALRELLAMKGLTDNILLGGALGGTLAVGTLAGGLYGLRWVFRRVRFSPFRKPHYAATRKQWKAREGRLHGVLTAGPLAIADTIKSIAFLMPPYGAWHLTTPDPALRALPRIVGENSRELKRISKKVRLFAKDKELASLLKTEPGFEAKVTPYGGGLDAVFSVTTHRLLDGVKHGSHKEFDPDRNVITDGQYANGKRVGEWLLKDSGSALVIVYNDDGKVIEKRPVSTGAVAMAYAPAA